MKKILLISFFGLLISSCLFAQDEENDLMPEEMEESSSSAISFVITPEIIELMMNPDISLTELQASFEAQYLELINSTDPDNDTIVLLSEIMRNLNNTRLMILRNIR